VTDRPNDIAAIVRAAIMERGLHQIDVARIVGLSQQAVSDRLNDVRPWRTRDLQRLAEHFGVTVAQLLEPPALLVVDEDSDEGGEQR
jgi:predicted transcriptional regulator